MHKNSYVLFFALIVTLTCSLLLATAANLLRDRQQENITLDKRKNILECGGLIEPGQVIERASILEIYNKNIKSMVVDKNGNPAPDKKATEINPKKDIGFFPVYFAEEAGVPSSYIVPISGKGLWSTIYGYIALEPDLNTVKGITFYQHGETPGLGGEIEKDWFKKSFIGKKILSADNQLMSVSVVKGKVTDKIPDDQTQHYVDGISGSTLTGNGLTNFLKSNLQDYEPYFNSIRNQ